MDSSLICVQRSLDQRHVHKVVHYPGIVESHKFPEIRRNCDLRRGAPFYIEELKIGIGISHKLTTIGVERNDI